LSTLFWLSIKVTQGLLSIFTSIIAVCKITKKGSDSSTISKITIFAEKSKMHDFDVTILGCSSAMPTKKHFASSQIVRKNGSLYMIDCAEGTQIQFFKMGFRPSRLNHIFISHTHGDHCLGLIGLLSTFSLSNRTAEINVYAPKDFESMLFSQIEFYLPNASFHVVFHALDFTSVNTILEDKDICVQAFLLNHRVPCYGFLFYEKKKGNRINKTSIERYNIPIKAMAGIKEGDDLVCSDGKVIPNSELTIPAFPPRKYAYCSDTKPVMSLSDTLQGVDLLYHDSTYIDTDEELAIATGHSTASQAATFAKQCGAKKLILGHFSSRYKDESVFLDDARSIFPASVLADEGLRFTID
jgi:ribonuclease Z